ncbi:cytochrome P450 [Mycena rebaudengoi]|nr:cytochrome P450 [Mycena rebaudengoi]
MTTASIFCAICTAVFFSSAIYFRNNRAQLPLPPGPYKWPILGNLFDIPLTFQWKKYLEWSKKYNSDIIHLNVAGNSIIILCSVEATNELLGKRSSTYSDRPRMPMINELMGWDFSFAFMKYGPIWRTHRKMFQNSFDPIPSLTFRPTQLSVNHRLLRRILEEPDNIMDHLRHMTSDLILSLAYGIEAQANNDPYVALAEKTMASVSTGTVPGKFVVDALPFLKYVPEWFPGAGFKNQAKAWKKLAQASLNVPFAEAKRKIATGIAQPSFVSHSLRDTDKLADPQAEEDTVKAIAGTMYIATADTTLSALGAFVLGMLANPEAQKKAQREIDAVTSLGRLPDFDDEKSLPYVSALVKEALRWQTVVPLGLPHFIEVEDVYRGYRIPAGSIVVGNTWAISHDEAFYPDPYSFNPERFLLNGKLNPEVMSPDFAFGYGRRICPGRHLAMSSMWISIVSILATCDITKAVGDDGNVIEPTYEYNPGAISLPLPFKCSIKPRSQETVELIQATGQ